MAKTKQTWKSVHLVPLWSSVKRTFQTGQKAQKEAERWSDKKEWVKREALKHQLSKRKWERRQKRVSFHVCPHTKDRQHLTILYNAFCTIKWCGGQDQTQSLPWSRELLAPVGLLFQPICFCLLTDRSQASLSLVLLYSLMLSIWTCERTALWSSQWPALLGWRVAIVFGNCFGIK